jgi:hypothetical protein
VITKDTYDVRSTQILNNLNWLPIARFKKTKRSNNDIQSINWSIAVLQYLVELFTRCQNNNYNLRSNQTKLAFPKPKTHFLKRAEVKPSKIIINYQSCRLNG